MMSWKFDAQFHTKVLEVSEFTLPDGKIEQFQFSAK